MVSTRMRICAPCVRSARSRMTYTAARAGSDGHRRGALQLRPPGPACAGPPRAARAAPRGRPAARPRGPPARAGRYRTTASDQGTPRSRRRPRSASARPEDSQRPPRSAAPRRAAARSRALARGTACAELRQIERGPRSGRRHFGVPLSSAVVRCFSAASRRSSEPTHWFDRGARICLRRQELRCSGSLRAALLESLTFVKFA